jgi:hypothetical protein
MGVWSVLGKSPCEVIGAGTCSGYSPHDLKNTKKKLKNRKQKIIKNKKE